jgi:hypothetical protein
VLVAMENVVEDSKLNYVAEALKLYFLSCTFVNYIS